MTSIAEHDPDLGVGWPPDPEGWGEPSWADELGPLPVDEVDEVLEWTSLMNSFVAQRLAAVDTFRRRAYADAERYGGGSRELIDRSVRLELAAALRVTEHAAGDLLGFAAAMVHRYPAAWRSLSRSGITERHARILVEQLDAAGPEISARVGERALLLAEQQPVGVFRRKLRALVDTEQAATLAQRQAFAVRERRVEIEPGRDGMGWLHLHAPLVELHAVHARLTAQAKAIARAPGETRTLDEIRADAACDLLIDGDTTLLPADARGIRATVAVTVPALTLLAAGAGAGAGAVPPVVDGIGPISVEQARVLCGGADGWMRVLTHPETGAVLSVGRESYKPPASLRRLVRWRAGRCMAPGCSVPADRCEIDHTVAWEHGGHTSLDNHSPLCKGHHTVKHHGGWQVDQIAGSGGALRWRSPSGRIHVVRPERTLPTFHPDPPPPSAPAPDRAPPPRPTLDHEPPPF